MVFFQIQSSDEIDYIFVNWGYFSGVLFLPCDNSFGGFSSVIRFFTRNSDFGLHSWWCVLFDGRGTLAVSTELELICSVFCFPDLPWFFPTPTENHYFDTKQLLLNINLSHRWMSLVLSSVSDFDSDLIICLDPYFGKNVLFVLASCLIFQRCSRDVKCLYYLTNWRIFYWEVLGELLCHLFEKLVF